MDKISLEGPYLLDVETINHVVTRNSPGVYVLGSEIESIRLPTFNLSAFKVRNVGRSDKNLGLSLTEKIGIYPKFKFAYAESPESAFRLECKLWHNYGGPNGDLDMKAHPRGPEGSGLKCIRCQSL